MIETMNIRMQEIYYTNGIPEIPHSIGLFRQDAYSGITEYVTIDNVNIRVRRSGRVPYIVKSDDPTGEKQYMMYVDEDDIHFVDGFI